MEFNLIEAIAKLGVLFVPFLFALCFHEYAHGYVARLKGDRTAELMGRLTMNPLAHMDVIGTFVLPVFAILSGGLLFGWAKPVPVNERNLKHPLKDMFWIALAGPMSNVILAVIGSFLWVVILRFLSPDIGVRDPMKEILEAFIVVNLYLAFFNMIPLHPLDGGKVLARFLPANWNRFLEDNQMALSVALILFFVSGGFRVIAGPVDWTARFLMGSMLMAARTLT